MKNLIRALALLLPIFFYLFPALSQNVPGRPFVLNYEPKDYGGATQNWGLVQDNRGLIYVGNNDGVLEYDGQKWRLIETSNSSLVRSIFIDKKSNTIFVGAKGEMGYLAADAKGRMGYVSLMPLLDSAHKVFADVWSGAFTGGKAYFLTDNFVAEYDGKKFRFAHKEGKYLFLGFGAKDVFYAQDIGKGLKRFIDGRLVLCPKGDRFETASIRSILPAKGDSLLMALSTGGLGYYNAKTGDYRDTGILTKQRIYAASPYKNGGLLIGTLHDGAFILDENLNVLSRFGMDAGLTNNDVLTIYADQEDQVWMGLSNGLSRMDARPAIRHFGKPEGIENVTYKTIRHNGDLYLAMDAGLLRLNKESGKFDKVEGIENDPQVFSLEILRSPTKDKLFAGTNIGLYEVSGDQALQSSSVDGIFSMLASQYVKGGMYVGTSGQLFYLNMLNPADSTLMFEMADNVQAMHEDLEGLWMATEYNGVFRFNKTSKNPDWALRKEFEMVKYDTTSGLGGMRVTHIGFNSFGKLLFSCPNAGFYEYEPASKRFVKSLFLKAQLDKDTLGVESFVQDFDDDLFIVLRKGRDYRLGFVKNGTDELRMDVFARIPYMQISGLYPDPDHPGVVWISGSEGLFRFDKNIPGAFDVPFSALIRKVVKGESHTLFDGAFPADGKAGPGGLSGGFLKSAASTQTAFFIPTLEHTQNSVTFYFAGTSFIQDKGLVFSYKLKGNDKKWSEWAADDKKQYTNLWEGDYVFMVKAKNIYGKESAVAEYAFKVSPPWFRTYWAYALYFVATALLVWAIVSWNTNRLKRENERLETIIDIRTKEIRKKTDDLTLMNSTVTEKNAELELQKEEILVQAENLRQANTEIIAQKENLQKSFENIKVLSGIGREITSTLDLDKILDTVYESVNELMSADVFGIGLLNKNDNRIDYRLAVAQGVHYKPYSRGMEDKNQFPVWCLENKEAILINDVDEEYNRYIRSFDRKKYTLEDGSETGSPCSMIYLPLIIKEEARGVITVQSFDKNAYTVNHLNMLSTLAIYAATAIDNSNAYNIIKRSKENITDSIRYAKTIQIAFLPSLTYMSECLEDYFVLYRPKDIVSGDLYWFAQVDGKNFIAAIDCTGHGVPGAFMSMVGNSLLNEIIKQSHIYEPSLVLELLDEGVRMALKQDEKANDDGMDVCLCLMEEIGNNNVKTVFCGAKRPLYYWDFKDSFVKEIKGNKRSVGGLQLKKKNFYSETVTMPKGSILYLTTDGYADQNDAAKNKFGTVRLLDLFEKISHENADEIKDVLEKALDEHQGTEPQRDDITVLGVRV